MKSKATPRGLGWVFFAGLAIVVSGVLTRPRAMSIIRLIGFGIQVYFFYRIFTAVRKLTGSESDGAPRHVRKTRSEEGRWLDAPIAEVDKSTTGILLGNRWKRDPSLRVMVRRGGTDATPSPHGGLWDRELDG